MDSTCSNPRGEMILRTSALPHFRTSAIPADTNANGDIFGEWILSQMDIAGGILAKEIAGSAMVTVAVDAMNFLKSVQV